LKNRYPLVNDSYGGNGFGNNKLEGDMDRDLGQVHS